MSPWDRRLYFEQLCELRTRYQSLGDDDTEGMSSIDDAMAEASAALDAIAEPEADLSKPGAAAT